MDPISVRLDDSDRQKLLAFAEQNGTNPSGMIRKFIKDYEEQNRLGSLENRVENIEETLNDFVGSCGGYLNDLLRTMIKIDLMLHYGLVCKDYVDDESGAVDVAGLEGFYSPIQQSLKARGFTEPGNGNNKNNGGV